MNFCKLADNLKRHGHNRDRLFLDGNHGNDIMEKNPAIGLAERLYSSRITAAYIKFLQKEYGHADIGDILSYAGMETCQVEDEAHWFTQEQVDRFNERVVKITGKQDISREAGRCGLSPDSIGSLKNYILGHMSTGKAFEMVAQISRKFVKSCTYESARLASNKIKIVVTPRPGVLEKPYQCQNRIGYFEAFSMLFHHKFPQVEHGKCIFNGDEYCEYVMTWREFRYEFWKKVWTLGGAALLAAASTLFLRSHVAGLTGITTALVGLSLFSSWVGKLERQELHAAIDSLSRSMDDVTKKMETSDNHARMTQEVGHILTRQESVAGVLREVTRILEKRLDYDRGVILIADKSKGILEAKDMFGYSQKELEVMNNGVLGFDASDMLPVKCFRERRPFLVNDLDEPPAAFAVNTDVTKKLGIKSFLCCPIVCAEEAMGVLAVDNMRIKRVLLQSDVDLLTLVAQEMGVTIQNLVLKQTEKALRESEALFRAVVEKSSEVLVLTNNEGGILYVSPPVVEGFGYNPPDLNGKKWSIFVHPNNLRAVGEAAVWVHENPGKAKNLTARMRHKDGSWRWVETTMRDLLLEPGVGSVVSNLRDITDRRRAERALLESENKFRDLVEKAMVGVYLIRRGVFLYVNAKFADIHGYDDPEMMRGMVVRTRTFFEDIPPLEGTEAWRREDDSHSRQFRIVRKDGKIRYVETYGRYTTYQGEPAVIGMIIDVTDRKNAEAALRWKTTFLEALVDSSRDGILVVDNRMQKVLQNDKFVEPVEDATGYRRNRG